MRLQTAQTAFVFPGQGSQTVGMGRLLAQAYPVARQTFQEADEILGFPISHLAWDGPDIELNDTINTQPALLVHSVAVLRVLQEKLPDFAPAFVAGHSMGELSALVACGALPYPAALQLVRTRGRLMKQAGDTNPGGMAAIVGLDIPALDKVCEQASQESGGLVVQVANDNCPGQVVISGARPALERAVNLAQQAGARRVIPLAVSIAAHSPLMTNAQEDFNQAVDASAVQNASIPLIGNVTAIPLTNAADIRKDLQAQLTCRVRWTESIQIMAAHGVTTILELGSGNVLTGLIKRIDRKVEADPIGNPEDFDKVLA